MRIIENHDTGETASVAHARRKAERLSKKEPKKRKAIPKVSKKRKEENKEYSERRILFLNEYNKCPVNEGFETTEIHHKKGRQGYADQWAKDHGITLLLDERYWLAVSASGHRYIENHPQEAKDRRWSLSRLGNIDLEPEII